jgi:hypothetical protein
MHAHELETLLQQQKRPLPGTGIWVGFSVDTIVRLLKDGQLPSGLKLLFNGDSPAQGQALIHALLNEKAPAVLTLDVSYTQIDISTLKLMGALSSGRFSPTVSLNLSGQWSAMDQEILDLADAIKAGKCPPRLSIKLGLKRISLLSLRILIDAIVYAHARNNCPPELEITFTLHPSIISTEARNEFVLYAVAQLAKTNVSIIFEPTGSLFIPFTLCTAKKMPTLYSYAMRALTEQFYEGKPLHFRRTPVNIVTDDNGIINFVTEAEPKRPLIPFDITQAFSYELRYWRGCRSGQALAALPSQTDKMLLRFTEALETQEDVTQGINQALEPIRSSLELTPDALGRFEDACLIANQHENTIIYSIINYFNPIFPRREKLSEAMKFMGERYPQRYERIQNQVIIAKEVDRLERGLKAFLSPLYSVVQAEIGITSTPTGIEIPDSWLAMFGLHDRKNATLSILNNFLYGYRVPHVLGFNGHLDTTPSFNVDSSIAHAYISKAEEGVKEYERSRRDALIHACDRIEQRGRPSVAKRIRLFLASHGITDLNEPGCFITAGLKILQTQQDETTLSPCATLASRS